MLRNILLPIFFVCLLTGNLASQKIIFSKNYAVAPRQYAQLLGSGKAYSGNHAFQMDNAQNILVILSNDTTFGFGYLAFAGDTFRSVGYSHLLKMDSAGNELWGKDIATSGNIYTDNDLNIYIWGGTFLANNYMDTVLINSRHDPASAVVNPYNPTLGLYYLLKLDPNGNYLWSKFFSSSEFSLIGCQSFPRLPASFTNKHGVSYLPLQLSAADSCYINSVGLPGVSTNRNYFLAIDKNGNTGLIPTAFPASLRLSYLDMQNDGALHFITKFAQQGGKDTINGILYTDSSTTIGTKSFFGTCDTLGNILTWIAESDVNNLHEFMVDRHGNTILSEATPYTFYNDVTVGCNPANGQIAKVAPAGGLIWDECFADFRTGQGYSSLCQALAFADNDDIYAQFTSQNGMIVGNDSMPAGTYLARISSTGRICRWYMAGGANEIICASGTNKLYLCDMDGHIEVIADTTNVPATPTNCHASYGLVPDTTTPHNWFAMAQTGGNPPITYIWNWGDGTFSSGSSPSHTYSVPGYYDICLSVYDDLGCSASYCNNSTYINHPEQVMITVNVINQATGIELPDVARNSGVYPNPAFEFLHIDIGSKRVDAVAIYNLLGQQVKCLKFPADNKVDIRDLAEGVYIAAVRIGDITEKIKWIKQ